MQCKCLLVQIWLGDRKTVCLVRVNDRKYGKKRKHGNKWGPEGGSGRYSYLQERDYSDGTRIRWIR